MGAHRLRTSLSERRKYTVRLRGNDLKLYHFINRRLQAGNAFCISLSSLTLSVSQNNHHHNYSTMIALVVFILIQHSRLFTNIAHKGTFTLFIDVTPIQLLVGSIRILFSVTTESINRFCFSVKIDAINRFGSPSSSPCPPLLDRRDLSPNILLNKMG